MSNFTLLSSEHFHVILHPNKKQALLINRIDNTTTTLNYSDAHELSNLSEKGNFYGIVGKFLNRYLILIKNRSYVGSLYEPISKTEHDVYVVNQVQAVDIALTSQIPSDQPSSSVRYCNTSFNKDGDTQNENDICYEAQDGCPNQFDSLPVTMKTSGYDSQASRGIYWNPFRIQIPFKSKKPAVDQKIHISELNSGKNFEISAGSGTNQPNVQEQLRLVEEMMKLINGTNSFYYSPTLDLTTRFSKGTRMIKDEGTDHAWKMAEERFFWNKFMIKDLIELSENNSEANHFICVILHGFISIKIIEIRTNKNNSNLDVRDKSQAKESGGHTYSHNTKNSGSSSAHDVCQIALISRRSVYRAGTRYRRRGCDEQGNCANFVETEQIFRTGQHFTSLSIVRGSIPLFWYQTGVTYRPPPVLARSEADNFEVLNKHFIDLMSTYETQKILVIDCTEHTGREKPIHDVFKRHIIKFQEVNPDTKLIEFDFHRHCRGRQCSETQVEKNLKSCGLDEQLIKDIKYYWNDGEIIWKQNGLIRVNCLDCTDRTNVVQKSCALQILDLQLARLGIISPDMSPDENECRKVMQEMWAANGNVLSTQYCGTRALFGGDKKLAGYLQDTYNSASRYYISKFRDAYRQAAIDAMLGLTTEPMSQSQRPSKTLEGLDLVEPLFSRRIGGTLLKDMGSRVTDRIAKLKGKFYDKQPDWSAINMSALAENPEYVGGSEFQLTEVNIDETLRKLNIDWPSSENVANEDENDLDRDGVFGNNADDDYQDDDFDQLVLSIDLDEFRRLHDEGCKRTVENSSQDEHRQQQVEEIDMTETCPIRRPNSADTKEGATSTTST